MEGFGGEGEGDRGTGKAVVPNIGEWQCTFCGAAHCWNTRLSCYRCGTHRNWQSGGAGPGGFVRGQGRGNGVQMGVVGPLTGGSGGFIGQGWCGVRCGRGTLVRPQLVVIRRMCLKVSPPAFRTAIASVSNGSFAATDLLDATLVEGMERFSGPAIIVLGDNGWLCSCGV